jgi:heterodisulfide reductase subunit C
MENTNDTLHIEPAWLGEVEKETGIGVSACYQCKKCTNGCPVTFAMDIYPDQVIRLVQMGQKDRVLSCSTIWVCSACETCTTRCPNGVDVAGVMDYLKETAVRRGADIPQSNTYTFHRTFLDEIRKLGRISEAGLIRNYMLKSGVLRKRLQDGSLIGDLLLGWSMFKKGRMNLLPKKIKARGEISKILK